MEKENKQKIKAFYETINDKYGELKEATELKNFKTLVAKTQKIQDLANLRELTLQNSPQWEIISEKIKEKIKRLSEHDIYSLKEYLICLAYTDLLPLLESRIKEVLKYSEDHDSLYHVWEFNNFRSPKSEKIFWDLINEASAKHLREALFLLNTQEDLFKYIKGNLSLHIHLRDKTRKSNQRVLVEERYNEILSKINDLEILHGYHLDKSEYITYGMNPLVETHIHRVLKQKVNEFTDPVELIIYSKKLTSNIFILKILAGRLKKLLSSIKKVSELQSIVDISEIHFFYRELNPIQKVINDKFQELVEESNDFLDIMKMDWERGYNFYELYIRKVKEISSITHFKHLYEVMEQHKWKISFQEDDVISIIREQMIQKINDVNNVNIPEWFVEECSRVSDGRRKEFYDPLIVKKIFEIQG